ncbi:MAG TPA: hypothetical protein VLJ68_02175 [Chitinophagaceae bacterium]|nr:hypothetical protein [Chitinophagaceae bacterium]
MNPGKTPSRRVVIVNWKDKKGDPFEVFSNLKILCKSYPQYNYNTLNNYLSKGKVAYENDDVRIERKMVHTAAIRQRKIAMVGKRVDRKTHDDDAADKAYWLSRPVKERLDALTFLRAQFLKKGQRMDRTHITKRKL